MVRSVLVVLALLALTSAAAAAQHTIGVSAVVLERVEAVPVELEIRSARGGLRVQHAASAARSDSRLLQSTFVSVTPDATAEMVPVRVYEGGTVRVERRSVGGDDTGVEELGAGESLLIPEVERLIVTRVVASNS